LATDCHELPSALCEAAAAVALAHQIVLESDQALIGWRARPTSVVACGGPLEPKVDVDLEFANPTQTLTITVGVLPDGRLVECTF
jgi:hypothetical protein